MIRTRSALAATALAVAVLAPPSRSHAQERSGPSVTPYGFLLLDAFWNSGPFANKDNANQVKVPTVADSGGSFIGSARGSRLGMRIDGLDVGWLAARLTGLLEFDFKGGHFGTNSASWNAFGPRLRLAYAKAEWTTAAGTFSAVAGQDWGLIANVNPTTVTYNCDPVFVQSGNVYRRTPQVRAAWDLKLDVVGVSAAVAMLSPADAETQGVTTSLVDYGAGNKSRQPDAEARVAVTVSAGLFQGALGAGYHIGKNRYFFTSGGVGSHKDVDIALLGVDADLSLTSYVQLKGEFYTSKGAEGGYSGGFPAVFPSNPALTGAPPATLEAVTSDGWWGQLVLKPVPELWLAGGYGTAKASKGKLSTAAGTRHQSNQIHGAVIANAGKSFRFSVEAAQTESKYVVEGSFKATQISFATQLLF